MTDPGKNFKKTVLTTLLLAALSQPASANNLWEIYALALANDPVYQIEELNHDVIKLNLPIAKTAFHPFATASARLGKKRADVMGTAEDNDDRLVNLNINLPLYNRFDTVAIKQSEKQVRISELDLQQTGQDLILRVATRYFALLAAEDAKEVARLEKIAIKRQMDLASERLEVGLGTRTDLFDAKARFKQAEANEIQALNTINNQIALLKQITGVTPEKLSPLSENAPLDLPQPNNIEDWVAQSAANNLALAMQSLNLEIALDEIEQQKSTLRPRISLDGNHRWMDSGSGANNNGGSSASGGSNTTTIGLTLNIPIYAGAIVNLKTRQAGIQYNKSERLLEQTRRSATTETTTAFLAVTSRVSQVEALYDAITAGESALEAKEEGFNAGLTTNIDVLDAQRDLSRSRTDYLRARYDYILSVLELEQAAGDLDEDDLKRVNNWLSL